MMLRASLTAPASCTYSPSTTDHEPVTGDHRDASAKSSANSTSPVSLSVTVTSS